MIKNQNFEIEDEIVGNKRQKLTNGSYANYLISKRTSLNQKKMHRVVLTGGPCSGKSTCLNRIKNFFENIGWKVFCVPETATVLISTGINFYELSKESKINFQENLLKSLLQIEDSIYQVASYFQTEKNQNCLVIYDRGAMDPISYLEQDEWEILKKRNPDWNEVDLRDNRYDQVIHLLTAAKGAQKFYTLENNKARTESIDLARELDDKCSKNWLGHPYYDIIDNQSDFEIKVSNALNAVCQRIGLNLIGFGEDSKKRKFLIKLPLPDLNKFPKYKELTIFHNYLVSDLYDKLRIRKSGDGHNWSYSYTLRAVKEDKVIETRTQITKREYSILLKAADPNRYTVIQNRRCFIWNNRYFRLDIFNPPLNDSQGELVLLSTRTNQNNLYLPDFIQIDKEVTDDPNYFMFNLSLKPE